MTLAARPTVASNRLPFAAHAKAANNPPSTATAPDEASTSDSMKDWTILGFFNGDNNLEPEVVQNVIDASQVGPNKKLNFVAQLARAPQDMVHAKGEKSDHIDGDWSGVRRYEGKFEGKAAPVGSIHARLLEKLPAYTSMGSPEALADFLRWGIKNYPAKHYMIVINDHGAGFRGASFDDVHDSNLKPFEMREVLEQIKKETGVKPDIIAFDACLMAQAEVAYELRNSAHYLVGSEDTIGGDGLPYPNILAHPAFADNLSGRDLSKAMVEESATDEINRLENGKDETTPQFGAIDLTRMEDLRKSCDKLSQALQKGGLSRAHLTELIKRTQKFHGEGKPDKDFRDLGDFAQRIVDSKLVRNDAITRAAQGVLDALKQVVVVSQKEGEGMERTHGLSIYLPTDGIGDKDDPDPCKYQRLQMSKDGKWPELLSYIHPTPEKEKASA